MENSAEDFSGKKIRDDVQKILNKYGDGIDKVVAFGSQLLDWDLTRQDAPKNDADLVPIMFLRNFVENIDAINILVRHAASNPSLSLLRTVLENYFSLEYLLTENQQQRSICFHVWNTRQQLKLYEKLDGSSEPAKQMQAMFKKDKFLQDSSPMVFEFAEKMKANAAALLALPLYKEVADEYERTKQKLDNPNWYSLYDGPRNIQGLAQKTQSHALYEIYRMLSTIVHGNDIIQGKMAGMGDGKIGIDQLRFPRHAQMATQYAHNIAISAFATYVNKRLPGRKAEYTHWFNEIKPLRDELMKGNHFNITD